MKAVAFYSGRLQRVSDAPCLHQSLPFSCPRRLSAIFVPQNRTENTNTNANANTNTNTNTPEAYLPYLYCRTGPQIQIQIQMQIQLQMPHTIFVLHNKTTLFWQHIYHNVIGSSADLHHTKYSLCQYWMCNNRAVLVVQQCWYWCNNTSIGRATIL